MASVTAKRKNGTGKLTRIIVEITANGAEVTKQYEPPKGKDGFPMYQPDSAQNRMSFDDRQKAADYVEECLTGHQDDDSKEY